MMAAAANAEDWQSRTRLLIGEDAAALLQKKTVAVLGLGGVGSFAAEALARSGIGHLILIDGDRIQPSNLNRQLFALHSVLGKEKVFAAAKRLRDINPELKITAYPEFYRPENALGFGLDQADYIVDAADMVSAKIDLAVRAREKGIPLISAMGAGNKLNPEKLRLADLSETKICPLARVMRKELRKRGIRHLKVVYSEETARKVQAGKNDAGSGANEGRRKAAIGSMIFVPGAAGLRLAGAVIEDLIREADKSGEEQPGRGA